MSPASCLRRLAIPALVAMLAAGLLPAVALAADPVAVDDDVTVGVNAGPTVVDVLANDSDPDQGDTIDIVGATGPGHGTTLVDSGVLTYEPDPDYRGTDSFQYTIEDATAGQASATVNVIVNDPPVAVDDPSSACMDPAVTGGSYPIPEDYLESGPFGDYFVLNGACLPTANDTDANGDSLTYVIDSGPSHGQVIPDATVLAYKPDPDFSTPTGDWVSDTITYRAFDGLSYSNPATLDIWVAPINDPPTFSPGGDVTVDEDSGSYSGQWATSISPGPANESSQTVSFTLQPNVPVTAVCTDGGPLWDELPAIDSAGVLTFKVKADCSGTAHVTFRAQDDGGTTPDNSYGSLTPIPDDTADDVSFDINVEADAVSAVGDLASVDEDDPTAPVTIDVLGNDTFPVGATITAVTQGTKGSVSIVGDGSSVAYSPSPNANGSDTFTYTLDDGAGSSDTATVSVTITAENDAPKAVTDTLTVPEDAAATAVNVRANDTDVDGDTLSITGTTNGTKGTVAITGGGTGLTYDPATNLNGSDSFTYTVSDGHGGTAIGTVNVTITPSNDAPVATTDSVTVGEDALATTVLVLANDTDLDGDTLTITAKTNGTKGAVAIATGSTSVTYRPNANANVPDSFTYTISDGHGGTKTGTVNVTITPVNDPPDARTDVGVNIPESAGPTAVAVLANDLEVDGEALRIIARTNGAHGTVTITGGGTGLAYDPVQLYYGTDTFTYTVTDGHTSDTATVLLTVVKDTTAPTVVGPGEAFYAQTVATSTTRVKVSWSGSDGATGTGITKYELQFSVSGGAYASVALAHATDTSINRTQTDEKSYRYRVRARDAQGNVSAWVYGPTFKPGRIQNTSSSVVYAGPWATVANANALGGSHRYASSTSAKASLTRSVRDFAFVATRTADSGSAIVLIDNVVVATINLRASTTTYRQVVYAKHFSSLGTHTIEVRPAGGGRVYLDAFLIMR
jgi:hypothetical protein